MMSLLKHQQHLGTCWQIAYPGGTWGTDSKTIVTGCQRKVRVPIKARTSANPWESYVQSKSNGQGWRISTRNSAASFWKLQRLHLVQHHAPQTQLFNMREKMPARQSAFPDSEWDGCKLRCRSFSIFKIMRSKIGYVESILLQMCWCSFFHFKVLLSLKGELFFLCFH